MAEETQHSKLSPSSSKRWMHCAGSIAANENRTGGSSEYADLGTAAHALLDTCLRLDQDPDKFLGKAFHKHHEVDDDMCDAVGMAMDWVNAYLAKNPKAKIHLDKKVDPYAALRVHRDYTSGTLDIGIDNAPEELVIVDYKHGAGVHVDHVDNTQLMQYALGFWSQFSTRPYKRYRLVVIQPRDRSGSDPVRESVLTHMQLMTYASKLKKRIREIEKDSTDRVAGDWCMFCAGAGRCKTLAEFNMRVAAMEFGPVDEPINPKELDPEELDHVLQKLPLMEKWIKACMAEGVNYLMTGGKLENHKLVHGRTTRKWENEKKVFGLLEKDFDANEYAPRKILGVQKILQLLRRRIAEKGVKGRAKKSRALDRAWEKFKPLVGYSIPAIHLAPKTDPRRTVTRGEEFSIVEDDK